MKIGLCKFLTVRVNGKLPVLLMKKSPLLFLFSLSFACCLSAVNLCMAEIFPNDTDSTACISIPPLNQKVKAFVASRINKKEGNGSCWALAQGALNSAGASWDGEYKYGLLLDPAKDCIYPGDIIQFEGVEIRYSRGDNRYEEHMEHHTAVIYKVIAKGKYELAHQNFGRHKQVGITGLDIKNIISGHYFIYRPTR